MKRKKTLYIALIAAGMVLTAAVYLMRNNVSSRCITALMGLAAGMIGIGVSQSLSLGMEAIDPSLRRRNKIEHQDERNTAIRNRAKALSGDILQWAVIGAAWLCFGLGGPAWILLLALASLIVKCLLELWLTARYQKKM